jgi:hypothetical protein
MEIRTYHGKVVSVKPGQFVVNEYYKGFLNDVRVFSSIHAAQHYKDGKVAWDSYNMQRNYNWRIQEVK